MSSLQRYGHSVGLQCRTTSSTNARQRLHSLLIAGRPVQVLQACAVQVIEQSARLREPWTQAFALQTVCRCAPQLDERLTSPERR